MNVAIINDVFNALDTAGAGAVNRDQIIDALRHAGIRETDPRVRNLISQLIDRELDESIPLDEFRQLTAPNFAMLERATKEDFVIPQFAEFADSVREVFEKTATDQSGNVAQYIPQLARVNPDQFAVAICTIDGQRLVLGDADTPYCFQSTCKPVLYCAALEEHGETTVHQHVGREPSGRSFNELTLNPANLPHNPMINAGAIMSASLIRADEPRADRFEYIGRLITALSGGAETGFNNAVYQSEAETADRNFALAHYMREVGAFPKGVDIQKTLDLYFACCSMEITADQMALMAASLANGGVCPVDGMPVFRDDTVKNCLSMMSSCGMYDYSGEFAFRMGIPAKSGVSGAVWAVIPNVMGIAVWSPRLDALGNSVRGVRFLRELIDRFNFHNYDSLVKSHKTDPRRRKQSLESHAIFSAIQAASNGDLNELKRLVGFGQDLNCADYDGRTPLHLAAAEGRLEAVRFLLNKGVDPQPLDRWNNTPLDDARRHSRDLVVEVLTQTLNARNKLSEPMLSENGNFAHELRDAARNTPATPSDRAWAADSKGA